MEERRFSDAIFNYYNDNLAKGALLIDGEWGEGKTHFITEILPELIKDKTTNNLDEPFAIKYISLFGLETRKQIERQLVSAVEEGAFNEDAKENGLIDFIDKLSNKFSFSGSPDDDTKGNVGFGVIGATAGYLGDVIFDSRLKSVISSGALFCFDDLERWHGDIRIPLAYISHLVERNKARVLIICNVNKLDSTEKNKEEPTEDGENTVRFNLFKEKVVSKTIEFSLSNMELQSVFNNLVKSDKLLSEIFHSIQVCYPQQYQVVHLKIKNIRLIQKALTEFRDFCARYEAFFLSHTHEAKSVWEVFELAEICKTGTYQFNNNQTHSMKLAKKYCTKGHFDSEMDNYFLKGKLDDNNNEYIETTLIITPPAARIINSKVFFSYNKDEQGQLISDFINSALFENKLILHDIFFAMQFLAIYVDLKYIDLRFDELVDKLFLSIKKVDAAQICDDNLHNTLLDVKTLNQSHGFEIVKNQASVRYVNFESNISDKGVFYTFKNNKLHNELQEFHKQLCALLDNKPEKKFEPELAWEGLITEDAIPSIFFAKPNLEISKDVASNLFHRFKSSYNKYLDKLSSSHFHKLCLIFESNLGTMYVPSDKYYSSNNKPDPEYYYGSMLKCIEDLITELESKVSANIEFNYSLKWLCLIHKKMIEEWENTYSTKFSDYKKQLNCIYS